MRARCRSTPRHKVDPSCTLQGRIRRHTPAAGGAYGGFAIAARETRTPRASLSRAASPRLAHLSTASTRALGRDSAYRRPRRSVDPRGAIRIAASAGWVLPPPVLRDPPRFRRTKREVRSQPFLSRFQATLRSVETYGSGRSFQAFAGGREAVFGAEAPRSGGCRVRDRACERGGDRRALGPWRQPAAWLGGELFTSIGADHRAARRVSRAHPGGAARAVAGARALGSASTGSRVWHRWNGHACLYLVLAHVVFSVWGYALIDRFPLGGGDLDDARRAASTRDDHRDDRHRPAARRRRHARS